MHYGVDNAIGKLKWQEGPDVDAGIPDDRRNNASIATRQFGDISSIQPPPKNFYPTNTYNQITYPPKNLTYQTIPTNIFISHQFNMFSTSRILLTQRTIISKRGPYNPTRSRTSRPPFARTPLSRFIHSKRPINYVYSRTQKGESLYTTIKRAERKSKLRARKAAKERQDKIIENLAGLVVGGFILGWLCVRLREGSSKEVVDCDYEQVCGYAWRGGIV